MAESLLDGLNAGIFVEQGHPSDAACIRLDEEREPQARSFLPCFFINNPRVKQPVVGKDIVEGELRTMHKGIKHQRKLFPSSFPWPLGEETFSLIRLCLDIPDISREPSCGWHLDLCQQGPLLWVLQKGLHGDLEIEQLRHQVLGDRRTAPLRVNPGTLRPFLKDVRSQLLDPCFGTPSVAGGEQQTQIDEVKVRWTPLREAEGGTTERGGDGGFASMIGVGAFHLCVGDRAARLELVFLERSFDWSLDGGCVDRCEGAANGLGTANGFTTECRLSRLFSDKSSDGFDHGDDDMRCDDRAVWDIARYGRRGDAVPFFSLLVQVGKRRGKEWGRCTGLWRCKEIEERERYPWCFWNRFDMEYQRVIWIERDHTRGALLPEKGVSRR